MKNNNDEKEVKNLAVVEAIIKMDFSNAVEIEYPDLLRINEVFKESPNLEQHTENELRSIVEQHSVTHVLEKIKRKFLEKYNFFDNNLHIIHDKSFYELNMFYTQDKNGNAIFCDVLFSDFIHAVFVIAFLWDEYVLDDKMFMIYYKYMITVFYALIANKDKCDIYKFKHVLTEIKKGSSIFNVAVGCQYFSLYFAIAHEVAHAYIKSMKLESTDIEDEYLADAIAYEIILEIFLDERKQVDICDRELLDYCYMAPMMLCDLFEIYYFLYPIFMDNHVIVDNTHPAPYKRKKSLFAVLKKKYGFIKNNEYAMNANTVYSNFGRIMKEFRYAIRVDNQRGKLNSLINFIRGKNDE